VTFGAYALKLLKTWIKHRKLVIMSTIRIRFLKFCINNNITPQHLYFLQRHNINLSYYDSIKKYESRRDTHIRKILKLELNDAFRTLHNSKLQVFHLAKELSRWIPTNIGNSFLFKQEQSLHFFQQSELIKINKKNQKLKHEKRA